MRTDKEARPFQTPRDWVCVPREPTDSMLIAGISQENTLDKYKAMIIAAPDIDKGSEGAPIDYFDDKDMEAAINTIWENSKKGVADCDVDKSKNAFAMALIKAKLSRSSAPTDGEMEAALEAFNDLLYLFDTHCHENGIDTLLESGELMHHEHIDKINRALTKKSRGTV